ncbi:DciA family protein [Streptomyces virginiae]|uniref:DciA family protein n=1 Tax=Streptomyces virginiae TaxID=1961 RepID=UPI0036E593D4
MTGGRVEQRLDLAQIVLQQARQDARGRRGGGILPRRAWHRSGPASVQTALSELLAERGWTMPARHSLAAAWADIVGPEISAHLLVVDVDGGQLVVRADSKAWANQVRLLEPQLVARLNQHPGLEAVRCLRVLTPPGCPATDGTGS